MTGTLSRLLSDSTTASRFVVHAVGEVAPGQLAMLIRRSGLSVIPTGLWQLRSQMFGNLEVS